jgi:alpha-ketoglutarate-dependent taurine dioxygenase
MAKWSIPTTKVTSRWSEGDIGIWDNRATQHHAVADYEGRRAASNE